MEAVSNFHDFVSGLPEAAVYDIRACLKSRGFAKDEIIFRGGEAADHLYQLASGQIALTNYSVDGQEIILTKYRPGDWFGDTGIMDGRPRINTAIALEDTQLLVLSGKDFHALCERHPQMQRNFCLMQANHIRMLLNLLVDASLLRLPARVARTIQRLLISLGKQDADKGQYIQCSHDELARYVAASRQSTSIELKKLEQAGIIHSAYGKIYVLDQQALNDLCDQLTGFEPIAASYHKNQAATDT